MTISSPIRQGARHRRTLITTSVLLVGLALLIAGCGSSKKSSDTRTAAASSLPGKGKPPITLGDKEFSEEYVLGELYAQALRAKGYTVTLKKDIGSTQIIDGALRSGQIQMYPEYTGTILQVLAHQSKLEPSAGATYQAAKRYEQRHGFTLLAMTPFYDQDAVGVLQSYAKAHQLATIGDLRRLGSSVSYGEYPQNIHTLEGFEGLQKYYGLKQMKVKSLAIGLQYPALRSGAIQAADVFTTDPQLRSGDYKILTDTKHIFGFQNVAPVVSEKLLKREGPAFAKTIDAVSADLTLEAVRRMDAAASVDRRPPAQIASLFLKANGLA